MHLAFLLALGLSAGHASAETLVATRTIRAQQILTADDVVVTSSVVPGTLSTPQQAVGQEAKVVLYAGRPIHAKNVGSPALINRNDLVVLIYRTNGLTIATQGRALGRAGSGDRLRVMNLSSRSTVDGTVDTKGRVFVTPSQDIMDALE